MPLERAIGRAILRGLAREGIGISRMIGIVRAAGGGYNYQSMLNDARMFTERLKYQTQITNLTGNQVVPRAWMSEVQLGMPYRYRVFGEVTFYDPDSNQHVVKTSSFYSDDYLKKGDYEAEFMDFFEKRYDEENLELISFKQTSVEHNLGYSY